MARFSVHDSKSGTLLLDCQADGLSHFGTRVVTPLLPRDEVPPVIPRLHPMFEVQGKPYVMATHLLTAVPVRELGPQVASLAQHDREILNALDMLLTGV